MNTVSRDRTALNRRARSLDLELEQPAAALESLSAAQPSLHAQGARLPAAAVTLGNSRMIHGMVAVHAQQLLRGYRLLRELGRGATAAVWLAERLDGEVKRQVALKLPLLSRASPAAAARFDQEKEVLARLSHPHIARLYAADMAEGQAFMVLEYVDGEPITEYCDRHKLDIHHRLQLFLQVLDAVAHAHQHSVVHRDLKPSNILVDVHGQVKLLDFGIAKLLDHWNCPRGVLQLTQRDQTVLTPAYAAPEQVNGEVISMRTDIFVLGVVLHELLSGASPYAAACGSEPTLTSVIGALLRGTPTHPSQAPLDAAKARARSLPNAARLQSVLKGDLDAITHKALQYEPAQRYDSAERFAEDLRSFLSNRTIAARQPGLLHALSLFLRRHRAPGFAICLGAALSFSGAVASLRQSDALDECWSAPAVSTVAPRASAASQ